MPYYLVIIHHITLNDTDFRIFFFSFCQVIFSLNSTAGWIRVSSFTWSWGEQWQLTWLLLLETEQAHLGSEHNPATRDDEEGCWNSLLGWWEATSPLGNAQGSLLEDPLIRTRQKRRDQNVTVTKNISCYDNPTRLVFCLSLFNIIRF